MEEKMIQHRNFFISYDLIKEAKVIKIEEIIRTESWQDDEFIIVIETDNKVYKVGPPVTDHNEIEEKIDEIIKLKEALWRENASKEDRKVIEKELKENEVGVA